jgi:hypothetical protein
MAVLLPMVFFDYSQPKIILSNDESKFSSHLAVSSAACYMSLTFVVCATANLKAKACQV